MVSVATLRTFEIELSVSLTCWSSRVKPKENEVLSLTIYKSVFVGLLRIPLDWIEDHYLREYASG